MLPSGIKNSQYQCTIATGLVSKSGHAFYAMQLTGQLVTFFVKEHTYPQKHTGISFRNLFHSTTQGVLGVSGA